MLIRLVVLVEMNVMFVQIVEELSSVAIPVSAERAAKLNAELK